MNKSKFVSRKFLTAVGTIVAVLVTSFTEIEVTDENIEFVVNLILRIAGVATAGGVAAGYIKRQGEIDLVKEAKDIAEGKP